MCYLPGDIIKSYSFKKKLYTKKNIWISANINTKGLNEHSSTLNANHWIKMTWAKILEWFKKKLIKVCEDIIKENYLIHKVIINTARVETAHSKSR